MRFFDPRKEIDFVGKFRPALIICAIIPLISIVGLMIFGIDWGIDFSGGSEMQVKFSKEVPPEDIREVLDDIGFDKNQVQSYGARANNEMLIRVESMSSIRPEDLAKIKKIVRSTFDESLTKDQLEQISIGINTRIGDQITMQLPFPEDLEVDKIERFLDDQHEQLAQLLDTKSGLKLRRTRGIGEELADINESIIRDVPVGGLVSYTVQFMGVSDKIGRALTEKFGTVDIRRVEFVDSQVSKQLRTDGTLAVIYALIAILIYIAIRFDILFSPGAIVALLQDTFGALMVFVFGRYEFDLPSIAALLTIVGYSINNTIVIYDRIRETMPSGNKKSASMEQVSAAVNKAINDTFSRTINTSLTTLFATVSLLIFAGGVIKSFALVLTVGIILGAFSSTFAAPGTYLFLRKRMAAREKTTTTTHTGPTREEKAKGVV